MIIPYLSCMLRTAAFYRLPPRVLPAIQMVEGGKAGTVHRNTDHSADLGPMQVNTLWIPAIAAYTQLSPHVVRQRLTFDPCFNVAAAGAILRAALGRTNGNLMLAIGDYHSVTPTLNAAYQRQVLRAALQLFGDAGAAAGK